MKKKTYLIILIILLILFGITSYTINNKKLNIIERTIKDTGGYIEKVINLPIKYIGNKITINKEKKNIYEKYNNIKKEIDKIDLYKTKIKELEKELKELKDALEIKSTLLEYDTINATVINRNVGYWYNNLTIDKGLKNGVKEGMAVIVNEGLIGKIETCSNYFSTVKLLTTNEILNKISVKIDLGDNYLYGLLDEYDSNNNVYKIEGITNSNLIKEGLTVTTTGLTDYFPSGIIIGKVSKIVKDEYDLNSIVEVKPTVNFNDINIVTILSRKASN